jgi:uncharacterized membrane protein
MIWLLFSVVLSASLVLIFRAFAIWKVNTPRAILVNYFTCLVLGNVLLGDAHLFQPDIVHQPWLWPCVGMGVLFISVFSAVGWAARIAGAGLTALASKMGLLIPVLAGILLLNENYSVWLWPGIAGTLFAIYLLNPTKGSTPMAGEARAIAMILIVFIGSGIVDSGLKLIQFQYLHGDSPARSTTMIFGSALFTGMLFFLLFQRNNPGTRRDIPAGLLLGVFNYFSVFAMLKALDAPGMTASWFFPINNLGVVLTALFISMLVFGERLSWRQWLGVATALCSILVLSI